MKVLLRLSLFTMGAGAIAMGYIPLAQAYNYHDDYERVDTKTLTLPASSLKDFYIEAGAGSLKVIGGDYQTITVVVDVIQREKEADYCLSLMSTANNDTVAKLEANTCHRNSDTRLNLTVTVPQLLLVSIEDSSGWILAENASVQSIKDGSGKIEVANNRVSLTIDDGSGAIIVEDHHGDLMIEDGSGSIDINHVAGKVSIEDGSGSISVNDAEKFTLIDDGSGSVSIRNVKDNS